MKFSAFVVVLGVVLFGKIATAQSRPHPHTQRDSQQEVSTWPTLPYSEPGGQDEWSNDRDDVCYTMRTYMFARNGAAPPRLLATYTCAPSHQRDLKRAKAAEPKMVPAR